MTRILDCFIAYNEIDMILTRMHILRDVVDYHVIVEAETTHSAQPKPMYIADAMQAGVFDEFRDKIVYMNAGILQGSDSWERERYHRRSIQAALETFAESGDMTIVADADEIPHPRAVKSIVPGTGNTLPMKMYYYNLHRAVNESWGVGVLPFGVEPDPNKVRTLEGRSSMKLHPYGWHLSYFMSPERIVQKVEAFMHHADIAATMPRDPAWVAERVKRGEDLFGRAIQIDYMTQPDEIPAYIAANRSHYVSLGWLDL